MERAADASRQLGDSKNFGRLLEEIRCQLHSGYKFNHRDRGERRVYFRFGAGIVERSPRRTPMSGAAFHRIEPRGRERHGRAGR